MERFIDKRSQCGELLISVGMFFNPLILYSPRYIVILSKIENFSS